MAHVHCLRILIWYGGRLPSYVTFVWSRFTARPGLLGQNSVTWLKLRVSERMHDTAVIRKSLRFVCVLPGPDMRVLSHSSKDVQYGKVMLMFDTSLHDLTWL